jgi:hypothetical protein
MFGITVEGDASTNVAVPIVEGTSTRPSGSFVVVESGFASLVKPRVHGVAGIGFQRTIELSPLREVRNFGQGRAHQPAHTIADNGLSARLQHRR